MGELLLLAYGLIRPIAGASHSSSGPNSWLPKDDIRFPVFGPIVGQIRLDRVNAIVDLGDLGVGRAIVRRERLELLLSFKKFLLLFLDQAQVFGREPQRRNHHLLADGLLQAGQIGLQVAAAGHRLLDRFQLTLEHQPLFLGRGECLAEVQRLLDRRVDNSVVAANRQ